MRNNIDNTEENKFRQTTAFVFDRFYGSNTSPVSVLFGRFLIAAAISFLAVGYVFSQYDLPIETIPLALGSIGFTAVFSLIFAFVKKRWVIPLIAIVGTIIILWSFDAFWERFSYFCDAFVLQFNGRIFDTTTITVHPLRLIEQNGVYTTQYVDGATFGSVILCAVFAMITAAGLIGKPCILPSLITFILLLSPLMASERLHFDLRIVPLVALYAGAAAVGVYYRDGLAIRHVYVAGGYRRKIQMDDRRFNASVANQNIVEKAAANGLRYSKYFSSIISAAAVFTAIGLAVSSVCRDSTGINYQPLYDMLSGVETNEGGNGSTPFRTGPEANYFVSPANSIFGSNSRMQLTSPSRSAKEILRVTKTVGMKPLYLRGDIGIDFDGSSWSSAVIDEPAEWRSSGLYHEYLPIEYNALFDAIQLAAVVTDVDMSVRALSESSVTVEYLCDTDVVFAPAYDSLYSAYGGEYDVYGDYAVRRKSDKSINEMLSYIAVIPTYSDGSNQTDLGYFQSALRIYDQRISDLKLDVETAATQAMLGMEETKSDYGKYAGYVYEHYTDVPNSLRPYLENFLEQSGLNEQRTSAIDLANYSSSLVYSNAQSQMLLERYVSAMTLSEFLKENYTYSLDTRIDNRDPVMSFLEDTKSGHCALYASAMTLILRDWGIPARYCTGFAASADLKMQTLRSRDLHAWCEVYFEGMGWITFDPTASAIFGNGGSEAASSGTSSAQNSTTADASSSAQSSQTVSSTPESSEAIVPASSTTHDISSSSSAIPDGTRVTFKQILPYLLTILGILAGIAVIALLIIAYIKLKKRADKQIQSYHRNENSELVYSRMLDILRFGGLSSENGEQPHEFFERCEDSLDIAICDNYELLERLAFGNAELDTSERAVLGFVLEKIYRAVEGRYKFIGKIRLRIMTIRKAG